MNCLIASNKFKIHESLFSIWYQVLMKNITLFAWFPNKTRVRKSWSLPVSS